jgi:hypothetical protein
MELVINEKDEQIPELFDLEAEDKNLKNEEKPKDINLDLVDRVVEEFKELKQQLSEKETVQEKVQEKVEEKVQEKVEEETHLTEQMTEKTRSANPANVLENEIKVIEKENKDVTDAEKILADNKATAVGVGAGEFANQAAKDAQIKLDEAKLAREKADVVRVDNNLKSWTRMDLFPGITRERVYPRTVHQRTVRKDFLAKGMGKVYPFGHKSQYQMSGAGGSASDVIRLRRLYGRYKIAKNDGTEEVKPRKMGRLNPLT